MNTRILSVLIAATLVTVSSGCGSMGNFFFGRGARCGLCNRNSTPAIQPAPVQPYVATPYTQPPVQAAPMQQPVYQAPPPVYQCPPPAYPCPTCQSQPAPEPKRSGCFMRNWFGRKKKDAPAPCPPSAPCYSCYGYEMGDCGCGHSSIVTDPYLVPGQIIEGGTVINGGTVIDGGTVINGGTVIDGGTIIDGGTMMPGDGFRARRYDTDGARIIWSQPATEI